jgi:hypothetical protein
MSTNFADTCITHCGDLASKKHHDAMEGCLHSVIIKYNAATLIQNAFAVRYIKISRHVCRTTNAAKLVRLKVCAKLFAGRLGRAAMSYYHEAGKYSERRWCKTKVLKGRRRSPLCLQVNVQHVQPYIEPGCAFCILPQRIEGLSSHLGMYYFSDVPLPTTTNLS